MPWGLWSDVPTTSSVRNATPPSDTAKSRVTPLATTDASTANPSAQHPPPLSWSDTANRSFWDRWLDPKSWGPLVLTTTLALGVPRFYRSFLRRIPGTAHIAPRFFRCRTLLGRVTSVGDGDNFHLFHTPGGRLAGWGWFFKVPTERKELKGRTIPIRIAGIDAPECAHFGRPAQPHSNEALAFLRSYVLGRRVRARLWKRDQYERAVATVWVRRPPFFFPARDVGLEMLRRGLAAAYDAKTGAEYGGQAAEARYRAAEEEARKKGRGMWAPEKAGFFGRKKKVEVESPRGFKDRMRDLERAAGQASVSVGGKGGDGGVGPSKRGMKTGHAR